MLTGGPGPSDVTRPRPSRSGAADRGSLAQWMRGASRRVAYDVKTRAARYPALARPLTRLRGEGVLVDGETDLLVEGFPRCASSFAVAALEMAQEPRSVRVAHHVHSPAHVVLALRAGVPALVLIRDPQGAVISNLIRHPSRTVTDVLRGYVRFYAPLWRHRSAFVVGTFHEVVNDFGTVIRRVNSTFCTRFREFEHTPENIERCFREIEEEWTRRRGGGDRLERIVPRPSPIRDDLKDEIRAQFLAQAPVRLRTRAEGLYEAFVSGTSSS
jgi:hypothetical protein